MTRVSHTIVLVRKMVVIECATAAEVLTTQVRTTVHSVLIVLTVFCICNVLAAMRPKTEPPNISLKFAVQQA